MNRNIIGYTISSFGLGIVTSASIYPMGYLESEVVFRTMILVGNLFIIIGVFIRPTVKKKDDSESNHF